MHIYGRVVLHSILCPWCGEDAFLVGWRTTCCDRQVTKEDCEAVKFELDMIGARRRKPPKAEQRRILAEQDGCCFYCEQSLDALLVIRRGRLSKNEIHWDHVIPFVFSGANDGFVASCALCNQRKHDKLFDTLEDARNYLRAKDYEDKQREKEKRHVRHLRAAI